MALIACYEGDVVDQLVNRVMGPDDTGAGAFLVVESASFDSITEVTTAVFRPFLKSDDAEWVNGELWLIPAAAGD